MREVWCQCGKRLRLQRKWTGSRQETEFYLPGTFRRVKHCPDCGAELTLLEPESRPKVGLQWLERASVRRGARFGGNLRGKDT